MQGEAVAVGRLVLLALGAQLALGVACGAPQDEPRAAEAQPGPGPAQVGTGFPSGADPAPTSTSTAVAPCGPGFVPLPDGSCPSTTYTPPTSSSSPPNPPPPPPRKPGTVPGGLARGNGDPADKALLAGDKALLADKLDDAQRHFRKAKQLSPGDPAPLIGLVRVDLAKSGIVTDYAAAPGDRRIQALLPRVDRVLKKNADYGPALVERGRLLLILGQAAAALKSLQSGVKEVPGDPEAHSALGVALLATGKTEPALERFRRAVDLDPDNADRLTNLGTAYMLRGKVKLAIKAYQRAVQLAPKDPRAQGDLGTAYLANNQAGPAMRHLKEAVKLDARATFLSNLGYAYQLSGDLRLAIQTYREALQKDKKLGSAWINLGTALAKQGKLDEAEDAFKEALRLDPTDPRAKANLAELEDLRKKQKKP